MFFKISFIMFLTLMVSNSYSHAYSSQTEAGVKIEVQPTDTTTPEGMIIAFFQTIVAVKKTITNSCRGRACPQQQLLSQPAYPNYADVSNLLNPPSLDSVERLPASRAKQ